MNLREQLCDVCRLPIIVGSIRSGDSFAIVVDIEFSGEDAFLATRHAMCERDPEGVVDAIARLEASEYAYEFLMLFGGPS